MRDVIWQPRTTPPTPADREVHVWRLAIDKLTAFSNSLREILSDDERERAGRFRFEADRDRYVVARGILRRLLGSYTGAEPGHIRFAYAKNGKPRMDSIQTPVHFNVSHAGDWALIAFSKYGPVGVDVERTNRKVSESDLAKRFFSADEADALHAMPPDIRREAFLQCWTRKEAVIKAHGDGMSLPLDSFSVAFGPGVAARIVRAEGELAGANWPLDAPALEPGYAAAVCATWPAATFRYFAFAADRSHAH